MQMQSKPDVEAVFEFVGYRKENIYEGYRPSHLIYKNYLTIGIHSYHNLQDISSEELKGKKLEMYEGSDIVGYATITNILTLYYNRSGKGW